MKLTEQFLSQLEVEGRRTRRALENAPEGRDDWKPHEKSMAMGRLVALVAGIPGWVAMVVGGNELDLNPPGGSTYKPNPTRTRAERMKVLDENLARSREALESTTDEHLMKPWRLLMAGKVVSEDPRHVVLRDTFMHLAHHRGQLSVYLRLNQAPVPAIFGPSADDNRFD